MSAVDVLKFTAVERRRNLPREIVTFRGDDNVNLPCEKQDAFDDLSPRRGGNHKSLSMKRIEETALDSDRRAESFNRR